VDSGSTQRRDSIKPTNLTLGFGYIDECTTFTVNYIMTPRELSGTSGEKDRNQTLLFSLELRTLGQASYRQRFEGDDMNTSDR
jgi:LPS-assembly protein